MEKRLIIPVYVFLIFGILAMEKRVIYPCQCLYLVFRQMEKRLIITICVYNWHPSNAITTIGSYDFIDDNAVIFTSSLTKNMYISNPW
jgi:hypothetical protein